MKEYLKDIISKCEYTKLNKYEYLGDWVNPYSRDEDFFKLLKKMQNMKSPEQMKREEREKKLKRILR